MSLSGVTTGGTAAPASAWISESTDQAFKADVMDASLEAGLMLERKAFQLLFATEDQKEGARAFAEKRKPVFEGR